MKRIYDKQPREHHRKRSHYNSRGVAKLSFDNEKAAARYIKKKRLLGYSAYLCSAIIGTLEDCRNRRFPFVYTGFILHAYISYIITNFALVITKNIHI
jgi:hypothetical protein